MHLSINLGIKCWTVNTFSLCSRPHGRNLDFLKFLNDVKMSPVNLFKDNV